MAWREGLEAYIRREAQPVEKWSHQPRLYALARQLAQGTTADDDVLFAAAYMHDLGVFIGHRPERTEDLVCWNNTAYAVREVPPILAQLGFPLHKMNAVKECIAHHQPQEEPESIEATILRDADILEQLGAIAILRTVCKIGRDTRFHTFSDATVSLHRALNALPRQLRTEKAKQLAVPKVEALRAFLLAADEESNGEL